MIGSIGAIKLKTDKESNMGDHLNPAGEKQDDVPKSDRPEPWDKETARWYVEKWGDHPTNRMTVESADLQPDDRVLDIGCGSGTAVRWVALLVKSGEVIGVDPTPEMIRIAREKTAGAPGSGRIRFLEGSAEQLPIEDNTITVAMAINSIHHWSDRAAGLAEIRRVLVPGGRVIFGEEIVDDEETGQVKGDYESGVSIIRSAVEEAGFINVTISQRPVADEMMGILKATTPIEDESQRQMYGH